MMLKRLLHERNPGRRYGFLYRLDFASGKFYIGITYNPPEFRYRGHKKCAKANSQCVVHKAWRKYGPPKLTTLAVVEASELLVTEQRAVAVFDTMYPHGYNMTSGGEESKVYCDEVKKAIGDANRNPSAETRKKMSDSKKALPQEYWDEQGKNRRGWKHSPETKAIIRASSKGNKSRTGLHNSEEHRSKVSLALKGKPQTPELIEKRVAPRRGKSNYVPPWTEEQKKGVSGSNNHMFGRRGNLSPIKGRVHSGVECARISVAKATQWAIRLGRPVSILGATS